MLGILSRTRRDLIPVNRCRNTVVGLKDLTMSELVHEAVALVKPAAV